MSADIHVEMHHDHRQWESEIRFWRDDIAAWQKEIAQAYNQLKDIEAAVNKHETSLRQHAGSLRTAEERFDSHEHALAEFESGGSGTDLPGYIQKHKSEGETHAKQRADHEDFKRRHYAFMARWRVLVEAIANLK